MPSSPPRLLTSSLIPFAAAVAGCNNGSSSSGTSPTTPTPTLVTDTFNGSISQGGAAAFNFTVTNSGYNLAAGYTSISPANDRGPRPRHRRLGQRQPDVRPQPAAERRLPQR